MLIAENGLDPANFQSWVFFPGMRFNSSDKWWGDLGRRDFPHEGIDFCFYIDRSDRLAHIDHKTRIPVMHDGIVRSIFSDYLGQAAVIEHENQQGNNGTFVSIYAHTRLLDHIKTGVILKEGDIIATVADTSRSKAKILPHLHFTVGHPCPDLFYEHFVWNDMRDPALFALLDPVGVIDWPFLNMASERTGSHKP